MGRPADEMYPAAKIMKDASLCPSCGKRVYPDEEFRDSLSEREYRISGLCQDCQDMVFGGDE